MRIDSLTYFTSSLAGMRDNQAAISRLNQQIATGKALLAPKDDPLATEKILELSNRVAVRTQFAANQDKAELTLKYETTVVAEMNKTLTQARALLTGVNASQDPTLRNIHAEQLRGVFNHLHGLANSQDTSGNFIFSGFNSTTLPFANTSTTTVPATVQATTYNGTAAPGGTRSIDVEVGRAIQVNDNLAEIFQFNDATIVDPVNGAAAHDLLENLAHAIVNLPGGTITQADIDGYVDVLDAAIARLDLVEHRVAGALTEIVDVRATTSALLLQEKNALSDLQQVDQAAAIMALQLRQTALEAAGSAYARTSGLSLFSYLG